MRAEYRVRRLAYGRTQVVFGASLDVPTGSLTCLMGRNGVGKTTLLNTAMGLLPVGRARASLDGEDITKAITVPACPPRASATCPGPPGVPGPTVRENLHVVHERQRGGDPGAINDAVDLFPALATMMGRPAGPPVGRPGAAAGHRRALVTRPRLLALDEPTEGIQPSIIMQIEDAIAQLHAPAR